MDSDLPWPICQSCASPLIGVNDFGTEADGTRNREYCSTCFIGGQFTRPELTRDEMIELVAEQIASRTGMPRSRAEEITRSVIPFLKRWGG